MDFAVVTSLLGIVEQQLIYQPHRCLILLPADTQIIIQSLSHKLHFLLDYLQYSDPEAQKLLREGIIRDVAAEAEDKIVSKLSAVYLAAAEKLKSSVIEAACEDLHHTLQQVVKDIESVEVRIRDHLHTSSSSLDSDDDASSSSTPSSSSLQHIRDGGFSTNYLEPDESVMMIGLEDGFEKIKGWLIHELDYMNLEVISIVGMCGAGKTTLARKVYEDPFVSRFFEIRAWITVPHGLSRRQVLISLLHRIVSSTTEIYQRDDDELAYLLHRSLLGQRYLIVIDNLWGTQVWDGIIRSFPDDYNVISRVLITTQIQQVADYASSSKKYIYGIRFLDPVESWNLFVSKVFKAGVCPLPELEPIGRKIVEQCGKLPLTIIVIAGILVKLGMSPELWENCAQNMNSILLGMNSNSVSGILALTYLPTYLRICFLYLGIFPVGSDIHVKKLIKLWVAEGFLEAKVDKSLEEVAMDYLYDLIDRHIVLVVQQNFDEKIKSCRLRDSLHNFCLRKLQEENLVVSDDFRGHLVGTQQSSTLGCRWMSCQSHHWPITPSSSLNYNWGKIRSLLYFGKDLYLQKCSFIFSCLKLLRVLDLSLIKYWNGMPSEIVNLIHLRYLALTTTGSLSNFQLFKLQSWQTLILFSWMEECHLQLPNDILDLHWLRHVRVDKGSSLDLPSSVQENLQTLFWLKVATWDSKPLDFTRVPNLKEVGIYIEGEVSSDALDGLAQLDRLEKLKFELGRVEHFCLPISFPQNLKKLTLCKTYLPWKEMDIIGKLPNLEALKLKDFAFCGPVWKPSAKKFYRLKFLLVAHSDLEHLDVDDNVIVFPVLRCLALRCCWYLKEIPHDVINISYIRLIELIDCCPSLVDSAKRIQLWVNHLLDCKRVVVRHFLTKDGLQKGESSKEERKYAI